VNGRGGCRVETDIWGCSLSLNRSSNCSLYGDSRAWRHVELIRLRQFGYVQDIGQSLRGLRCRANVNEKIRDQQKVGYCKEDDIPCYTLLGYAGC